MGITLPVPLAPFEELDVQGESITIDVNAKRIVIPTNDQYILPSYNQWTENPNRCTLEETPCGGLKNSIVQDKFPGSLTIEGDGCYLQTIDGSYTGKVIGAGKLAETSSIVDSGNTGIAFATADGIEFRPSSGEPFLLSPPNAIVEEFNVKNISNDSVIYTITVKCPDSISSIELFNVSLEIKEVITLNQTSKNEYSFSRLLNSNSSESLQITVIYQSLASSISFSRDANPIYGLENMAYSWIAFIPRDGPEIQFFHFSGRQKQLSYIQEADGTISQITLYPGNGSIYHGRITHSNHTRVSGTGYVPDCLNKNMPGSIAKFLQAHGMQTDFPSGMGITTYVVPAISDTKILPKSEITDNFLGDTISLRICPGEYSCASFVINSTENVNLEIISSDLISESNSISADHIDLKSVKCWYQNGYTQESVIITEGRYLTPELLLNDDSLVAVSTDDWTKYDISVPGARNYLKLNTGMYIDISDGSVKYSTHEATPISSKPVVDSTKFLPINLASNYNKQLWITINIPDNAIAGDYTSTLKLKVNGKTASQITLVVTVLPIKLLPPNIEYSLYYVANITDAGSISSEKKTVAQYTADLQNMYLHGVKNPNVYPQTSDAILAQILSIRQSIGMDNTNFYYTGSISTITADRIAQLQSLSTPYDVSQVWIYGYDETNLNTTDIRAKITTAHNAGAKVFCAQSIEQAGAIADLLDLAIVALTPSSTLADLYHSYNHKIYSYLNPQSGPEYPRTFRLNYGLLLWQAGYDGVMDFAYQQSMGDIWNDFDHTVYRDHVFAYPTITGAIDTLAWEGYREAYNDMRYLATLQAAITEAHSRGVVTTDIDSWLSTLKTTDLSNADLDKIRSQMIESILQLHSSESLAAFLTTDGNPYCFSDGQQLFVRN